MINFANAPILLITHKNLNLNFTKTKDLLDKIRGRSYKDVLVLLSNTLTQAAYIIWQALVYSIRQLNIKKEKTYLSTVFVTKGSVIKKQKPGSKGKSFIIKRRLNHLTIGFDIR